MLRPAPMGWVDIVLDKRTAPDMLELIGDTEIFEPDQPHDPEFGDWNEVSYSSRAVRELWTRLQIYEPYLPSPDKEDTTPMERSMPFQDLAGDLDRRVTRWLELGGKDLESLSRLEQERESLGDLAAALSLFPSSIRLELWRSRDDKPRSYVPIVAYGNVEDVEEFLENTGDKRLHGHFPRDGEHALVRGLVSGGELETLSRQSRQYGLRVLDIPRWLQGTPDEGLGAVRRRIDDIDRESNETRDRLAGLSKDNRMAGARWLIERQIWLENALEQSHQGRNFIHIGGWVPRQQYPQLVARLKETGKPFLIRLDEGESHGVSPSMLNNPRWARSFELLVSGFGVPGINEVDPSVILALVTPLMFGYMFGDVGQGLLLFTLGWVLKSHASWTRLLMPAGVSAMIFGFLYGSVFSIEHWIPALWIHPMEAPLVILGAPLVFGAILMLLSLVFGYIGSRWRGNTRQWLHQNVPLLACYLAVPAWFISPVIALLLTAAAFFILIAVPRREGGYFLKRMAGVPAALLEMLEHWVQLMINTLSFARLGAFSLAHAGLSMALVSLSELPESVLAGIVVLVIGNLVITALEGLVVSVQTTRLVMFEFFRRFFEGNGRVFRPLTLGSHPGAAGRARTWQR